MFKNLIWVLMTFLALAVVITFSTVTTRADSDTNSASNMNAPVNGAQGTGTNAEPNSTIKNWHEVN